MAKKFKSPFSWWQRLKYWFWWNFQATNEEKMDIDRIFYGTAISKNGKRVDPMKFHPEKEPT